MPAIDYPRARVMLRLADVLILIGHERHTRLGQQLRGPCPLHGSRATTSRAFSLT
jgi:hypothetical protein